MYRPFSSFFFFSGNYYKPVCTVSASWVFNNNSIKSLNSFHLVQIMNINNKIPLHHNKSKPHNQRVECGQKKYGRPLRLVSHTHTSNLF